MRGALLGALLVSQICCDPEPVAPDDEQPAPESCGEATRVTRQDEFMAGASSADVAMDLAFMRDQQGRLVLVTSGNNSEEVGYHYDQIVDHVYFKLVEPPPGDGEGPFFPEDSELIFSSDPNETLLGYPFEPYHSSGLPGSIVLHAGVSYDDRESQPSLAIFADVLSRVEAGSHLVLGIDEPDARLEPSGGQDWDFASMTTGSPADGGDRSLLLMEYAGPDCDQPWDGDRQYALFRDVARGTSTTADAELVLDAPPEWNGRDMLVAGDLDGDGLTDLVMSDSYYDRIAAVPGGLSGTVALQDVAGIVRAPYYSWLAGARLIGGLDIDGDGLGDVLAGSGGATIYTHGFADPVLGGCVSLYRGADLIEGRREPWAVVAGDQPGEQLSTCTLERCGGSHFCVEGWDHGICDDEWGRGIIYVVPAELEGFSRVNDVAVVTYVGANLRPIVGEAAYDEEDRLLALATAADYEHGDYSLFGAIYLLSLDL